MGKGRFLSGPDVGLHHVFDHRIRDAQPAPREVQRVAVVEEQSAGDERLQAIAGQVVEIDARLFAEASPVDPGAPAELSADRLECSVARAELLALEYRRLAGEHLFDVDPRVARVQLANSTDIARGTDAEPKVRLVRPVAFVMSA